MHRPGLYHGNGYPDDNENDLILVLRTRTYCCVQIAIKCIAFASHTPTIKFRAIYTYTLPNFTNIPWITII